MKHHLLPLLLILIAPVVSAQEFVLIVNGLQDCPKPVGTPNWGGHVFKCDAVLTKEGALRLSAQQAADRKVLLELISTLDLRLKALEEQQQNDD